MPTLYKNTIQNIVFLGDLLSEHLLNMDYRGSSLSRSPGHRLQRAAKVQNTWVQQTYPYGDQQMEKVGAQWAHRLIVETISQNTK